MSTPAIGTGGAGKIIGMVHWPSEPSDKQARWLSAIASALGIEAVQ